MHEPNVVALALECWGLLTGALGILFVALVILNKLTGGRKKKED